MGKHTSEQIKKIKAKIISNRKKYKKTFVLIGWEILEYKYIYYCGSMELKDKIGISDENYDKLEEQYKKIAKACKWEPRAVNQVGFDVGSGSGSMIAKCLEDTKKTLRMRSGMSKR